MADLSITESNVAIASESSRVVPITFGETLLKGELAYLKASDGLYWKADSDASDTAKVSHLVIVGGTAGQIGVGLQQGNVSLGAILTAGTVYVLSSNSGKICAISDGNHASGDFITIIGVASTTSVLNFKINATGIAKP